MPGCFLRLFLVFAFKLLRIFFGLFVRRSAIRELTASSLHMLTAKAPEYMSKTGVLSGICPCDFLNGSVNIITIEYITLDLVILCTGLQQHIHNISKAVG